MSERKKISIMIVVSCILGAIVFVCIHGIKVLNPQNVDWLMAGGDLSQHYLGWKFFRNSEWTFPIGQNEMLAYPYGTSIIFTDSIPIFAVLFKTLRFILPADFQYFGLWGILCFMLQSMLGMLICRKYTSSVISPIVMGLLFDLLPFMIVRMYTHTALAAQWVILLAIFAITYYEWLCGCGSKWRKFLFWGLLGVLCASIHIYFIPMCGILCVAFAVYDALNKNKDAVITVFLFLLGACLSVGLLGGFTSDVATNTGGLGFYSANLNSLISPNSQSVFLKDLAMYTEGQYEGSAYLGLGILILAIIAACLMFNKGVENIRASLVANIKEILTYGIAVLLSIFVATGPAVSWGNKLIFEIELLDCIEKIWGIFRSSGRFMWIVAYLVVIGAFAICAQYFNKKYYFFLLLVFCFMQVTDLKGILSYRNYVFNNQSEVETILDGKEWEIIGESNAINNVYVSSQIRNNQNAIFSIADWASDYNLTLNDFWFSRWSDQIRNHYNEKLVNPDNEDIFVFEKNESELFEGKFSHLYLVGDYIVGSEVFLPGLTEYKEHEYKKLRSDDLLTYLKQLKEKENLTVFIAIRDEGTAGLTDEVREVLRELGLVTDFTHLFRGSYCAIISNEVVMEKAGYSLIEINDVLKDGITRYIVSSAGNDYGNYASIKINGIEYCVNSRGMNFVMYDNSTGVVVDSVCFDTYHDLSALRNVRQ